MGRVMRGLFLPLFPGSALALGGCAAGLAAGALGAAMRSGEAQPGADPDQGRAAAQACHARASQHGDVHIIDVERRSPTEVIVWGTVGQDPQRRSFQCTYREKISGFRLRPIKPRRGATGTYW
jgi:hypothetical protein